MKHAIDLFDQYSDGISGHSMGFHQRYTLPKALTWVWERTLENEEAGGLLSRDLRGINSLQSRPKIISLQLHPGNLRLCNLRRELGGVCRAFSFHSQTSSVLLPWSSWAVLVPSTDRLLRREEAGGVGLFYILAQEYYKLVEPRKKPPNMYHLSWFLFCLHFIWWTSITFNLGQ